MLVDTTLLELAPADHRATALSAVNTLQMAAMMVVFPVLAAVAGPQQGVALAFLLLAGGLTLVAGGLCAVLRHRQ
ncbi:MAG: hypothetical protein M0Z66_13020 [Thermaerobacter sp.]|nr:hypothetical protein [Thermaerobacter sp.]